jgi:hypothetical protein
MVQAWHAWEMPPSIESRGHAGSFGLPGLVFATLVDPHTPTVP